MHITYKRSVKKITGPLKEPIMAISFVHANESYRRNSFIYGLSSFNKDLKIRERGSLGSDS